MAASGAQAGALPFNATLSLDLSSGVVVVTGSGTAVANGSGGGSHIDSLALAGSTVATTGVVVPITDPAAFPINGIRATVLNGMGTFSGGGGTLGGVMPLLGVAKVCLFGPCASAVANLSVPLSVVGAGGAQAISAAVNLTVIGAPWTTGTAAVGTVTAMGAAHGPASGTSSTFAPGGHLQLVTPIFFYSNIGVGVTIPMFATLAINFVPEPTTLLLLGGGIGALGLAGRARRH
jgi:hypothetical protein